MSANIQDILKEKFGDIEIPELDEEIAKQLKERIERSNEGDAKRLQDEFTKAMQL